ncbi:MAG: hypothetical protein KY393_01565 [Actinobacteria bacterium]|nr:hypothetical protein [Actinomycetota bacterium]
MRGKHSIVTPEATVRRRLKIASTALAPAMVLASFGVASALTADEQLAKDIECDIPGTRRTDCVVSVEEAAEPEATQESSEAAGTGATGADQSSTGSDAGTPGPAGEGTSQEPAPAEVSGSVIDDPQGFADAMSCEMLERFEMADLQCGPAS